jgi:PAS domain S-box-containing protein
MALMGSAPARPSEAAVQARIFRALHEVALAASGVLDPAELSRLAIDHARDLVGGWSATLVWFEPENKVRVLADNHPVAFPVQGLPAGQGMTGQIRETGEMIVVDDYATWEHAYQWAIDGGIRSMIGIPLKLQDEAVGCLLVRSRERGFFLAEPRNVLTLLAAQVAPAVQAAFLSAEREKQARLFKTLHELAVAAGGILDPQELARTAVEGCRNLLQVDGTVIFHYDRLSGNLQPLHETTREVVDQVVRPGEGAIGLAFTNRRPYAVEDYASWEHRLPGPSNRGLAAGLSYPLIAGDRAVGVIGVWDRTPRVWSENEIQILSLVAAQIGPALQTAAAARESDAQAGTFRALNELALAAAGVLEPNQLARIAAEKARDLLGSTSSGLTWWDDESQGFRVLHDTSNLFPDNAIISLAEGGAGAVAFESGRPVVVPDYDQAKRVVRPQVGRVKSALVVPLLVRDRPAGTIAVTSATRRTYSADDIQLLTLLAAVVAPSLEAARLHADLVASTRSTRAIFDTAPVGIARLDLELRILELNRRAEELTGYRAGGLVGKPVALSLIGAEDLPGQVADLVAGRIQQLRFERSIRRRVGGSFLAQVTLTAVHNPAGDADFLYAIFDDITERKRSEDALRESEARKSAIVGSALDCIIATDGRGRIIEFNPAAERTFGRSREEVLGKEIWATVAPEPLRAGQVANMQAILRSRADWGGRRFESIGLRSDGVQFPIEVSVAAFLQDGKPMFSASIRDLTERVLAETSRQESEAKSRFVAAMSHELRTPLNSILGFSQLLAGAGPGALNDRQQRYVGHIESSGRHLLALINDVLDLSKVEAGQMEVDLEPIELQPLLEEAINQLRPMADAKPLELLLEQDSPIWIRADRRRFLQVMLNLLSNAIKFTNAGGLIRVRAVRAGRSAEVAVIDTGIGIHPAQQQRIFEEFTQVEGKGETAEGTGLGLALTRRLLQLMRGSISLASVEGNGSTFTVTMPRIRPGEVADARPLLLVVHGPAEDPALLSQLESGNYRVMATGTAREAAVIARRRRLAGIVLGDSLSESDEDWLREALRDHPRTHALPILSAAVALHPGVLVRD